MKKHEMFYVFYEKLPLYDISSHKRKFVKTAPYNDTDNKVYARPNHPDGVKSKYHPPLPTSV